MTWNEAARTALRELGAVYGPKQEALLRESFTHGEADKEIKAGQERYQIEILKEIWREALRAN